MKNLLTFILLVVINFGVSAQNQPFRIDSLPTQGILLDKGWKWHTGDNADYAKPDFDDSMWENIDPTKKIVDLPQIQKAGIGWFRLHIKLDSSLANTILSLQSEQMVASEFYQSGKFIGNFGKVSNTFDEVQAYLPKGYYRPIIHFYTGSKNELLLAVRFALQPIFTIQYFHFTPYNFHCLSVKLLRTDPLSATQRDAVHGNNYEQIGDFEGNSMDYFKVGLFFILSLLHLCLYRFYSIQKANLFFGLGCLLLFIFYLYQGLVNHYFHSLFAGVFYFKVLWLMVLPAYLFILTAVYRLFSINIGLIFQSLAIVITIILVCEIINKPIPYIVSTLIGAFTRFDILRVSIVAYKNKRDGAWILLIGSIIFTFFWTFFLVYISSPHESRIPEHVSANIGYISIPISITLFLAREFAQTSKSLTLKLVEVQELSEEKQNSLLKQNEELQASLLEGQTIERKRVAMDLHDNLGSTLSALWLSVDTIDKSKMNEEEKTIYQNLRENLEKAYNDVRLLAHNLLPEEFEKQGLVPTLRGLVHKINKGSTVSFELTISKDFDRVSNKVEFELYSICLELVNNILKHSKATEAKIELTQTDKEIKLVVSDNGIGTFNNESDGKGMKNVKARVESLNGTWDLESKENKGTNSTINIAV